MRPNTITTKLNSPQSASSLSTLNPEIVTWYDVGYENISKLLGPNDIDKLQSSGLDHTKYRLVLLHVVFELYSLVVFYTLSYHF